MRHASFLRRAYLLPTPFDHQPIAVPAVPTAKAVIQDIVPSQAALSRIDEVIELLKHLPAACDRAKELQHTSQYASRYYRARFSRGTQQQQRQLTQVAQMSSAEAEQWARGKLLPITDPFQCA